ncbi:Uncharacterised protein [Yersinia frederiksenii]|nr:Uncharacterised protein [Yersinia frederiksenii]CNL26869.1 Uncharacterised protein [Yersinia frederiksenii]
MNCTMSFISYLNVIIDTATHMAIGKKAQNMSCRIPYEHLVMTDINT